MSFTYKPLWKLLIDRRMNKSDLKRLTGLTSDTIAKMVKDEPINMEKLHVVLTALDCKINDVVEFVNDHDLYPLYGKGKRGTYATPGAEIMELD